MANQLHKEITGTDLHAVERRHAGNPNGTVAGILGQYAQDTNTGDVYRCTGGTAWEKIIDVGTSTGGAAGSDTQVQYNDGGDVAGATGLVYNKATSTTTATSLSVTGAITASTLDTGQGDNELYAMNQNVRTTDTPTFGRLTLTQATGTAPLTISSTTVVTNLNADLVDGLQATSFLRSDANDTASGEITLTSTTVPLNTNAILFNNTENDGTYYTDQSGVLAFDENFHNDSFYGTGTYDPANVFDTDGGGLLIKNQDGWGAVLTSQNTRWAESEFRGLKVGANRVLTTADEGSGNGLDADTLDSQHGSYYLDYDNFTGTPPAGDAAGTDGQVQYNNGGSLAGANALYYDSLNGRVGINSISPDQRIHIESDDAIIKLGDANLGGPHGLQFGYETGKSDGMSMYYRTSSEHIVFEDSMGTSGNGLMVIKRSGNVGIGTATPNDKLEVDGTAIFGTSTYRVTASGGASGSLIEFGTIANPDALGKIGNYSSEYRLEAFSRPFNFLINSSSRLYIDTSGNVGIGTSSPSGKLDVRIDEANTYSATTPSSDYALLLKNDNAAGKYVSIRLEPSTLFARAEISAVYDAINASAITFKTEPNGGDATERMRITSGGNVGIGTTSPTSRLTATIDQADQSANVPLANLSVTGTASATKGGILHLSTTRGTGVDDTDLFRVFGDTSGTSPFFTIRNTGNVGIGTTSPSHKFHVVADTGSTPTVHIDNTGSDSTDGVALKVSASGRGTGVGDTAVFGVHNINGEIFRVQNDGNVGIGTTSPTFKLEVNGTTYLDGATTINIGRGDVYLENNANSNADGAGVTLRTSLNPTSLTGASIFDVRSSGQAVRLFVGQGHTSSGYNPFYAASSNVSDAGSLTEYNHLLGLSSENSYLCKDGGNVGIGIASPSYKLHVGGTVGITNDVTHPSFSAGVLWNGDKWRITESGAATFQDVEVRGSLKVFELVVKQISSIAGSEILSIANARIASDYAGSNYLYIEDANGDNTKQPFAVDDLWIIRAFDTAASGASGGSGYVLKNIYGRVSAVSGNRITVADVTGSLSSIKKGDVIVAYGSSTNGARDSIMYRNVDRANDRLIMRVQDGVNSISALTSQQNTRVAYGDLNGYSGISTETFGFFAGTESARHSLITSSGFFLKNATTTLAALEADGSDTRFRVGDTNNYLRYSTASGGSFSLKTNNINITAGSSPNIIGVQTPSSSTDAVFFAGSSQTSGSSVTDANTLFFVRADGEIYHPSIGTVIYARVEEAIFSPTGGTAASITDNEWFTPKTGAGTLQQNKIVTKYLHKFGIKKLNAVFQARASTSGTATFTPVVGMSVGGQNDEETISTANTYAEYSLSVDVSSLTPESVYTIEFYGKSTIASPIGSATLSTVIREDVYIYSST